MADPSTPAPIEALDTTCEWTTSPPCRAQWPTEPSGWCNGCINALFIEAQQAELQLAEALMGQALALGRRAEAAEAALQTVREERDEAQGQLDDALLDGPGDRWVCRTCGFMLTKAILRASDGAVGMDTREVHDVCPNDGFSLRRVTWKEEAADANRVGLEQMKRADELETALVAARQRALCVIGRFCSHHGFIHGAEAEELRSKLERELADSASDGDRMVSVSYLRFLLDNIDARDSLAYLEALAVDPAVPPQTTHEEQEQMPLTRVDGE